MTCKWGPVGWRSGASKYSGPQEGLAGGGWLAGWRADGQASGRARAGRRAGGPASFCARARARGRAPHQNCTSRQPPRRRQAAQVAGAGEPSGRAREPSVCSCASRPEARLAVGAPADQKPRPALNYAPLDPDCGRNNLAAPPRRESPTRLDLGAAAKVASGRAPQATAARAGQPLSGGSLWDRRRNTKTMAAPSRRQGGPPEAAA